MRRQAFTVLKQALGIQTGKKECAMFLYEFYYYSNGMNHKGQLSIEFLLLFVYFIMAIGVVVIVSKDFTEKQSEINIRGQETMIANSISKIVSASKGFENGTYTVEYLIPKINLPGKPIGLPCNIEIRQDHIAVKAQFNGKTVSSSINTNFDAGTNIDTRCDQTLTLSG